MAYGTGLALQNFGWLPSFNASFALADLSVPISSLNTSLWSSMSLSDFFWVSCVGCSFEMAQILFQSSCSGPVQGPVRGCKTWGGREYRAAIYSMARNQGSGKIPHAKLYGKIWGNVTTSFYMRQVFSNQLRNIEDGTVIVYYNNKGSPWIKELSVVEEWLREEAKCLDSDKIERPTTKWEFVSFLWLTASLWRRSHYAVLLSEWV